MAQSFIMNIRTAIAAAALALVASIAHAQQAAAPDPNVQALSHVAASSQEREVMAWVQAYTQRGEAEQCRRQLAGTNEQTAEKDKELAAVRGQVEELQGKLAAETKRADEATAKLNGTGQEK